MITVVFLLFVGLVMSAFFSGSETGLYRVTRVRLVLDSMAGDWISIGLLWLVNNPTLFVATSLIGNNLANYLVSYAIVVGTQLFMGGNNIAAELLAPIVLSPIVFVYGELLPKNLFYLAPNRLLRRVGPLLLLCGILFAPISAILWVMGRLLQRTVGNAPELVRLQLARQELRQLMEEGHEVGILQPIQRQIAQAVFDSGNNLVMRYGVAASRMTTVKRGESQAQLFRLARRHHVSEILIEEDDSRELIGYVRVIDLYLVGAQWRSAIRPLKKIASHQTHVAALMMMQESQEPLAELVDKESKTVGVVRLRRLMEPLYPSR